MFQWKNNLIMNLKKTLKILLIIVGAIALFSLSSFVYVSYKQNKAVEILNKKYQKNKFTKNEIIADIEYFREILKRVHPKPIEAFPLNDISGLLDGIENKRFHVITRLDFFRNFAPIVSTLGDEHVMAFMPESYFKNNFSNKQKGFPFEVSILNGHIYIRKNLSNINEIVVGAEILEINNIKASDLLNTMKKYFSGTRESQNLYYLQNNFQRALALVYGYDDFTVVLRNPSENDAKKYQAKGVEVTKYHAKEFSYKIINQDTILFTYNAFEDPRGEFSSFLKSMFTQAKDENIKHLIIDLRNNQGGSSAYGDELLGYLTSNPFLQLTHSDITISKELKANFIRYIPAFLRWLPIQYIHPLLKPIWLGKEGEVVSITFDEIVPLRNNLLFSGDIYLLTGPGTMSSASLFAATVKKYHIASLVGESAGGYATHYGNVITAHLPNTGIKLWMPTSINYGNSTGQIKPDIFLKQSLADLIHSQDTLLNYVTKPIQ
ncbi:MAG TPA: hypothetical protein ENJ60_07685 [Aeromonadales bacterium]|nr:hypothetical protein [Aeromonadales bacterium]